jgi:hypothetical protein
MADLIPRDAGSPLVIDDTSLAEFEGFGTDVPNTDGIIRAITRPLDPAVTRSNRVRAANLLRPGFIPPTLDPDAAELQFPTPDPVAPHTTRARAGLHDVPLAVPGRAAVTMWSLQDTNSGAASWPAPTIRVQQGQTVHTEMGSHTGPHTIHHHGIEPTPMNDGVGHLTFEVGAGKYNYQWVAGEAGTYFYHCHRNTTLHFERGMYGLLIIDPPGPASFDGGPGRTYVRDEIVPYAAEALWVADDIDPRWHELNVADGIGQVDADARTGFMSINDPQNPRLHDFNPSIFVVSGQAAHFTDPNPLVATFPGTAITPRVRRGEKLLIRTLNASYAQTRWTFPAELPGMVTAADGRTLGRSPFNVYSEPKTLESIGHQFALSTARRWDVLLDIPTSVEAGNYFVQLAFHHWITGDLIREVRLQITVAV